MVEAYGPDPGPLRQISFRMRMAASAHVQRLVPGQDGAFTAAILTGDRSGIDRSVDAALRASSLYHIVSISGQHMTLLAAAVFAMIRYVLALVPRLALAWPLKKIAAVVAREGFWDLDAPIERVGAAATPAPYAPNLEQAWLPGAAEIAGSVRRLCRT